MKAFCSQFLLVVCGCVFWVAMLNNLSMAGKGDGCGCPENNAACTGKDTSGNDCTSSSFKCVKSSTQSKCVYSSLEEIELMLP
jgi:hypothetical protein